MSEVFLTREEIEHPYANLAVMLEDKRKKAEQMNHTVFHRITQSPKVLAEKFIFKEWHPIARRYVWYSLLFNSEERLTYAPTFDTKAEAFNATVAKLKEVAE